MVGGLQSDMNNSMWEVNSERGDERETQQIVKSMDQKIDSLIPLVEQNQHAIFGHNGTPGILAWQQTHQNSCLMYGKDIDNLKIAIFWDPADRRDGGLKGQMNDLEEQQKTIHESHRRRDKIFWAAVSSSVTLIVTTIIQAIINADVNNP